MLISSYLIKKGNDNYKKIMKIEKYKKANQANRARMAMTENFDFKSVDKGMSIAMATGLLVFAIIMFTLEFLLLYFNLTVAFYCSDPGADRIIKIVLALIFPLPYALVNVVWGDGCVKQCLKSNGMNCIGDDE